MALLTKTEYKKYLVEHMDVVNEIFAKNYTITIYIRVNENWEILLTKTWSDGVLYTYDEYETSIEFIDYYLRKYVNFFLFSSKRQAYLLDTIKRIGDIEKAENILKDTIRKWYID